MFAYGRGFFIGCLEPLSNNTQQGTQHFPRQLSDKVALEEQ